LASVRWNGSRNKVTAGKKGQKNEGEKRFQRFFIRFHGGGIQQGPNTNIQTKGLKCMQSAGVSLQTNAHMHTIPAEAINAGGSRSPCSPSSIFKNASRYKNVTHLIPRRSARPHASCSLGECKHVKSVFHGLRMAKTLGVFDVPLSMKGLFN
jgi:hypothetical protein